MLQQRQGDLAASALPRVPCAMAFAYRAALMLRLCLHSSDKSLHGWHVLCALASLCRFDVLWSVLDGSGEVDALSPELIACKCPSSSHRAVAFKCVM